MIHSTARVVIIGGGVHGASTLWHRHQEGWPDVVLVEKAELTVSNPGIFLVRLKSQVAMSICFTL